MKKFLKLLTIGTLTSITSLQVMACTDDSKYKTFLNDVNNSSSKHTAIFGFLGSADNGLSRGLFNAFEYWQKKGPDDFESWKKQDDIKSAMAQINITDIELKEYQGPPHEPNQEIKDFWNDKSISWQRSIFKWVLDNKQNKDFLNPQNVKELENIDVSQKDSNNNTMFSSLPIVFAIVNGKLYTAGQKWLDEKASSEDQIKSMETFIISNILNRSQK